MNRRKDIRARRRLILPSKARVSFHYEVRFGSSRTLRIVRATWAFFLDVSARHDSQKGSC
jgi:hypothetical protein